MELSDKIAMGAVFVSLGSFFLALLSYLNARKALRLSEQEVAERKLPIISYLIDCFVFYKDGDKFCSFAISYTNQSSSPRTFSSLSLAAEFVDGEHTSGKAVIEPYINIEPPGFLYGYKQLNIPVNIPPKETVTGWISFKLPEGEGRKFYFNSYKVVGHSPDGGAAEIYAYLMRLVKDETKNEAG